VPKSREVAADCALKALPSTEVLRWLSRDRPSVIATIATATNNVAVLRTRLA
jgi:hypothetical protein